MKHLGCTPVSFVVVCLCRQHMPAFICVRCNAHLHLLYTLTAGCRRLMVSCVGVVRTAVRSLCILHVCVRAIVTTCHHRPLCKRWDHFTNLEQIKKSHHQPTPHVNLTKQAERLALECKQLARANTRRRRPTETHTHKTPPNGCHHHQDRDFKQDCTRTTHVQAQHQIPLPASC